MFIHFRVTFRDHITLLRMQDITAGNHNAEEYKAASDAIKIRIALFMSYIRGLSEGVPAELDVSVRGREFCFAFSADLNDLENCFMYRKLREWQKDWEQQDMMVVETTFSWRL